MGLTLTFVLFQYVKARLIAGFHPYPFLSLVAVYHMDPRAAAKPCGFNSEIFTDANTALCYYVYRSELLDVYALLTK